MPFEKIQIAKAVRATSHIADREAIAAFLLDAATGPGANAFPQTSVGAARHVWEGQQLEFRMLNVSSLGLSCLLKTLTELPRDTRLVREAFHSGPYKASVFHDGSGNGIVGAVFFGRPNMQLPEYLQAPAQTVVARRPRDHLAQLDLFASV